MTCDQISNRSNTVGATSGEGTVYSAGAPEFTPHPLPPDFSVRFVLPNIYFYV